MADVETLSITFESKGTTQVAAAVDRMEQSITRALGKLERSMTQASTRTEHLQDKLKELDRTNVNVGVHVTDTTHSTSDVNSLSKALRDLHIAASGVNANIDVTDVSKDARSVQQLASALERLKAVSRSLRIRVRVNGLENEARDLDKLSRAMVKLAAVGRDLTIKIRVNSLRGEIHQVERLARAVRELRNKDVKVRLDGSEEANREINKVQRNLNETDRGMSRLERKAIAVGALVGLVAVAASSVGVVGAGAAVGALAGIGGAALGAATALGILGAGIGAFALLAAPTISKVKDRFDDYTKAIDDMQRAQASGNWDAYDKALKDQDAALAGLNPAMRDTVKHMQDLKESWQVTAQALEPTTLNLLNGSMSLLKSLMPELLSVAKPVGDAFVASLAKMKTFAEGDVFQQFIDLVRKQAPVLIGQFTDLGTTAFAAMTHGMSASMPLVTAVMDQLKQAGGSLDTVFQSDGFKKFVDFAVAMLPKVRDLFGSLFGALAGLGAALAPLAGPALDAITTLADKLRDAFKGDVFKDLVKNATDLLPSLVTLLDRVVTVALKLADSISGNLSPIFDGFSAIITALLPGVSAGLDGIAGAVVAAVPGFIQLATILSDLLVKLAPSLPAFGELATTLVTMLAPALQLASDLLVKFADFFAGHTDLFSVIIVGILAVVGAMKAWSAIMVVVETAQAIWAAITGATWIATAVTAMAGAITTAAAWLVAIAPIAIVIAAIVGIGILIWKNWDNIKKWTKEAWDWVVGKIKDAWDWVLNMFRNYSLVGLIVSHWDKIKATAAALWDWLKDKVSGAFNAVLDFAKKWSLPLIIARHWDSIKQSVEIKLIEVIQFFKDLPGKIIDALKNLGSKLFESGKAIIKGLLDGILNAVPGLRSALEKITSLIPDWKGPMEVDARLLSPNGKAIMGSLIDSIKGEVPALQALLGGVTATIKAGVTPSLTSASAAAVAGGPGASGRTVDLRLSVSIPNRGTFAPGSPEDMAATMFEDFTSQLKDGLAEQLRGSNL